MDKLNDAREQRGLPRLYASGKGPKLPSLPKYESTSKFIPAYGAGRKYPRASAVINDAPLKQRPTKTINARGVAFNRRAARDLAALNRTPVPTPSQLSERKMNYTFKRQGNVWKFDRLYVTGYDP